MAKYLRPRRGKQSTAISQNIILKRGEVFFEVPTGGVGTGAGKIKMGDGTTAYSSLPYFLQQTTVDVASSTVAFTESSTTANATLLNEIASGATVKVLIGAIKKLLRNLNSSVTSLNNELSDHFEISEATLSSSTLATAIGLLLANASEKGTYSGRFKCSSGWFTFHCYYANDSSYSSGYVCSISDGTAYTFYCKAGADAVLKKLGSPEPEILTKTVTSTRGSFDAGGTVLFAGIASVSYRASLYGTKYGHEANVNASCSFSGETISWSIGYNSDTWSGEKLNSLTIIYAIE